jgi:hypothetical protein
VHQLDATRTALQKAEEALAKEHVGYLALNKVHLEFVTKSIKRFSQIEEVARELIDVTERWHGHIIAYEPRCKICVVLKRATALLGDPPASVRDFLAFAAEQAEWSQATFGADSERGPRGPLLHLAKEVQEALEHPTDPMEYVDCLFLTLDASRRAGFPAPRLLELAFEKLEINKRRKWNKPTSDNPVEHDRSNEPASAGESTGEATDSKT